MAYEAITDQEIAPNQPVSNDLLKKVKDNFDAHEAAIQSGLGGGSTPGVIPNGSLEADSDHDGNPDNWTLGYYSGGSYGIDMTDWAHGTRSIKFTAALSGVGNGGGWMLSDYVGVSPIYIPPLWFGYKTSVANMGIRVTARYYSADPNNENEPLAPIGDIALWTGTSHQANAWTMVLICRLPIVAGARYVKFLFEGGIREQVGTWTPVAGSVWFDGIGVEPFIAPNLISHGINLPWTYAPYYNENFIGSAYGFTLPSGIYSNLTILFDVDPVNADDGFGTYIYGVPYVRVSIDNGAVYSNYFTGSPTAGYVSPYGWSGRWSSHGITPIRGSVTADVSGLSAGAHTARFRGYNLTPYVGNPYIRSEGLAHYMLNAGRRIDALTGAVVDVAGKPTILTIP